MEIKRNKTTKRLGIAGLILAGFMTSSNIIGYLSARAGLAEYGSVEKSMEAHEKERIVEGILFDQIHDVFYKIGEDIFYKQHNSR